MKCPECNHDLIWGNDFDNDDETITSCYSCPECETDVCITTK